MIEQRPLAVVLASAILGLIALAAVAGSAFIFFAAWVARDFLGGSVGQAGAVSALLVGGLTLGYGVLAAFAAREVWSLRERGRVLGLIVGMLAVVAPVVALVTSPVQQSWMPLMYIAAALGIGGIVPLLMRVESRRSGGQTG